MKMKRQAEAFMPTEFGNFQMVAYADDATEPMPHLAMVHQDYRAGKPTLVRIHSECMTGDVFHSHRCDCGEQLIRSLELCARKGGIVVYLRQEGRGIGLINKLKAYNLQDEGFNTVEANLHLGHEVDGRQYDIAVQILNDLGVNQLHLLTNNPLKIEALEQSPIEVLSRVPLEIDARDENVSYLKTKQRVLGHFLEGLK